MDTVCRDRPQYVNIDQGVGISILFGVHSRREVIKNIKYNDMLSQLRQSQ